MNDSKAKKFDTMKVFLEGEVLCPCCQGIYKCEEGCDFEEDAPVDFDRIEYIRDILNMEDN